MNFPRRRSDLVTQEHPAEHGGGVLVYDPRTDAGHLLNAATAAVFAACDGKTSREQLATLVAAATDLPADTDIVELALAELSEANLLDEPAEVPGGLSRRSVIAKIALGAAAVAALPLIDSVARASRAEAGKLPTLTVDDKSATTPQDTPVDVTLSATGGYRGYDPVFWMTTAPMHGTVSISGDVATYTPNPGYTGPDEFQYTAGQCLEAIDVVGPPACGEGDVLVPPEGAEPATVTIEVIPVADTIPSSTMAPTTTSTAQVGSVTAEPTFTG
jgi:hypothetical protein